MAKCSAGNHGNCASCGEWVNANRDHSHNFHTYKGGITDVLCSECSLVVTASAGILLKALDQAGFHPNGHTLVEMMMDRRFLIGIQARFDDSRPPA